MTQEKKGRSYQERFVDIQSDKRNDLIPRVPKAGEIIDGHYVMHNGLLTREHGYDGHFSDIFKINRGVHEPQEEYVFQEILPYVTDDGHMIECGSNWAFYSMWFCQGKPNRSVTLIDYSTPALQEGLNNFAYNKLPNKITSMVGQIGVTFSIASLCDNDIEILHMDIQGYELAALRSIEQALLIERIKYVFCGTHSQKLHTQCTEFLKGVGYKIIASADFDNETYCYDGILVATRDISHEVFDIGSRSRGT